MTPVAWPRRWMARFSWCAAGIPAPARRVKRSNCSPNGKPGFSVSFSTGPTPRRARITITNMRIIIPLRISHETPIFAHGPGAAAPPPKERGQLCPRVATILEAPPKKLGKMHHADSAVRAPGPWATRPSHHRQPGDKSHGMERRSRGSMAEREPLPVETGVPWRWCEVARDGVGGRGSDLIFEV